MENQQSEALRLADIVKRLNVGVHSQAIVEEYSTAARELRRQHARIQELEAMLEAVGAGGVSAQRVTQGKDHIEQDRDRLRKGCNMKTTQKRYEFVPGDEITIAPGRTMQTNKTVSAPVVLPEPVAAQVRHIKEERWRTIALVLYDLFAGDEYELRYIYTEQQVRELLAKATCTKSQTQEPFGYFKAEPFGWRDCAETDEGAIALYEAPQPQADAPELLEFAKEWLSRRGDDDNYMTAKCRAAIAKAEGDET